MLLTAGVLFLHFLLNVCPLLDSSLHIFAFHSLGLTGVFFYHQNKRKHSNLHIFLLLCSSNSFFSFMTHFPFQSHHFTCIFISPELTISLKFSYIPSCDLIISFRRFKLGYLFILLHDIAFPSLHLSYFFPRLSYSTQTFIMYSFLCSAWLWGSTLSLLFHLLHHTLLSNHFTSLIFLLSLEHTIALKLSYHSSISKSFNRFVGCLLLLLLTAFQSLRVSISFLSFYHQNKLQHPNFHNIFMHFPALFTTAYILFDTLLVNHITSVIFFLSNIS